MYKFNLGNIIHMTNKATNTADDGAMTIKPELSRNVIDGILSICKTDEYIFFSGYPSNKIYKFKKEDPTPISIEYAEYRNLRRLKNDTEMHSTLKYHEPLITKIFHDEYSDCIIILSSLNGYSEINKIEYPNKFVYYNLKTKKIVSLDIEIPLWGDITDIDISKDKILCYTRHGNYLIIIGIVRNSEGLITKLEYLDNQLYDSKIECVKFTDIGYTLVCIDKVINVGKNITQIKIPDEYTGVVSDISENGQVVVMAKNLHGYLILGKKHVETKKITSLKYFKNNLAVLTENLFLDYKSKTYEFEISIQYFTIFDKIYAGSMKSCSLQILDLK